MIEESVFAEGPPLAPAPFTPPSEAHAIRRMRVALGTLVAIEAVSDSAGNAHSALESAFVALTQIERRMRPLVPDSDLARINGAHPHTPVSIDASTWELLVLARRLNTLTHGVFDPCLPERPGRLTDLELAPGFSVICHAPVALDFGGFAKGYAVDCAIAAMQAAGCVAGLVNAGGDLRVFGSGTERILVRRADGDFDTLDLRDAALAVSDADSIDRPREHKGYYAGGKEVSGALINRRAAVIAKDAVVADALVKCVMMCSQATATNALQEFGAQQVLADHAERY